VHTFAFLNPFPLILEFLLERFGLFFVLLDEFFDFLLVEVLDFDQAVLLVLCLKELLL
jgi:hypothetical protein